MNEMMMKETTPVWAENAPEAQNPVTPAAEGIPETVPAETPQDAPDEKELALWEEMLLAYPEADAPEKLPQGVAEAIARGKTPLVAMHEAEIRRLKGVIAAFEQREKAARSCGSVLGTAAPAKDPVLEILLGE